MYRTESTQHSTGPEEQRQVLGKLPREGPSGCRPVMTRMGALLEATHQERRRAKVRWWRAAYHVPGPKGLPGTPTHMHWCPHVAG